MVSSFFLNSTWTDFRGSLYSHSHWPQAALFGYWSKDKPLSIKWKSREGLARVKLIFTQYGFKVRMPESQGSVYSFCAKEGAARKPLQSSPKWPWPQTAELLLCSLKWEWNTSICSSLTLVLLPHFLPCLPSAPQRRAAQEREWSTSVSSQILSGGEGLLSYHETPGRVCLAVDQAWPSGLRMLTPWGLSMEGCRHTGVTSHSVALKLRTTSGVGGCTVMSCSF